MSVISDPVWAPGILHQSRQFGEFQFDLCVTFLALSFLTQRRPAPIIPEVERPIPCSRSISYTASRVALVVDVLAPLRVLFRKIVLGMDGILLTAAVGFVI